MIAVIDYGAGNIQSVYKALRHIGAQAEITRDSQAILKADGAILPGVGSFGDCMDSLNNFGIRKAIEDFIATGRPFLGICLGLQLLFKESEESPGIKGLDLLPGKIKRIPNKNGLKVPHIGWNSLDNVKKEGIFKDVPDDPFVYFVHSYYAANCEDSLIAQTNYGALVTAAVAKNNIFGCQFHPEKSGETGLNILKAFSEEGNL